MQKSAIILMNFVFNEEQNISTDQQTNGMFIDKKYMLKYQQKRKRMRNHSLKNNLTQKKNNIEQFRDFFFLQCFSNISGLVRRI